MFGVGFLKKKMEFGFKMTHLYKIYIFSFRQLLKFFCYGCGFTFSVGVHFKEETEERGKRE